MAIHIIRHQSLRFLILIPFYSIFLIVGCSERNDTGFYSRSITDPDGIAVVENSLVPKDWNGSLPILQLEAEVVIGVAEGPDEYMVSTSPRSIRFALGPDGTIGYVESKPLELRVYDARGRFLYRAGREGDGPGEIRRSSTLTFTADNGWIVYDSRLRRLVTFDKQGRLLDTRSIEDLPRHRSSISTLYITQSGNFWYQVSTSNAEEQSNMFYINWVQLYTLKAVEIATFKHPVFVEYHPSLGPVIISTYPTNFALDTKDRIWVNYDLPYQIEVFDPDVGLSFRIRREHLLTDYPASYRREMESRPAMRWADGHSVNFKLPPMRPAIKSIVTAGEKMWVFTEAYIDSPLVQVDVFDNQGTYVSAFIADVKLERAIIENGYLWLATETEEGVPQLVKYRYRIEH